jgi:methylmalonyl-CoA mutase N-terminal domain/subunit
VRDAQDDRDNDAVRAALDDVATAARGIGQPALSDEDRPVGGLATLGEVADVLRDEFGVYRARLSARSARESA